MKSRIAAHRGVASLAPENTLAGIRKAAELGLTWIEIDIQLSADGIPVVVHDVSVDRCSNGQGRVADLSWAELQQLDAGSWFDPAFSGEGLPCLEQVLLLCIELNLSVNLELKVHPGDDIEALCQQVALVIRASQYPAQNLIISSFDYQTMHQIKMQLPLVKRGQIWKQITEDWQTQLTAIDAYSVHCNYKYLTAQQAERIKQAGYYLVCYTANNPQEVISHWQWGVDLMITDTPQTYLSHSNN